MREVLYIGAWFKYIITAPYLIVFCLVQRSLPGIEMPDQQRKIQLVQAPPPDT